MNGRQNAYRQAEGINRILAEHGRDCPLCFRTCYASYQEGRRVVCPRCRGFGAVLNSEVFIWGAASPGYIQAIQTTDCPT